MPEKYIVSKSYDKSRFDRWFKEEIINIPNSLIQKLLRKKIEKFRQDELDHKDIAYDEGATKDGLYSIFDKVIKTGSKIAINISEKI